MTYLRKLRIEWIIFVKLQARKHHKGIKWIVNTHQQWPMSLLYAVMDILSCNHSIALDVVLRLIWKGNDHPPVPGSRHPAPRCTWVISDGSPFRMGSFSKISANMSVPSPPRPLAKAVMVGRTASDSSSHFTRPAMNSVQKELKDRPGLGPGSLQAQSLESTGIYVNCSHGYKWQWCMEYSFRPCGFYLFLPLNYRLQSGPWSVLTNKVLLVTHSLLPVLPRCFWATTARWMTETP